MQRPMTNYGNSWGVAPYSHLYGTTPYVGPFGGLAGGDAPPDAPAGQESLLTNTILQLVAAGVVGAAITAAAAPKGREGEAAGHGAGLAAGSIAVVNGFLLGFKESQPGLGVAFGLIGIGVVWISYRAAKKGY